MRGTAWGRAADEVQPAAFSARVPWCTCHVFAAVLSRLIMFGALPHTVNTGPVCHHEGLAHSCFSHPVLEVGSLLCVSGLICAVHQSLLYDIIYPTCLAGAPASTRCEFKYRNFTCGELGLSSHLTHIHQFWAIGLKKPLSLSLLGLWLKFST